MWVLIIINFTLEQFRLTPTKERHFKEILRTALCDIEQFECQFYIGNYRVDFYFPRLCLAVEFDEKHHNTSTNKELDAIRQRKIQESTGCLFIRVPEGKEIEGLNKILRIIKASYLN
ncbi:endonuclease domain-containing protein [Desulfoscipio gibsoniae]|uniref:DUF559 domain-containing protein n=1 Tax=Desulfoscipio gibsoniae DSM 7213 TaxID=767817 RepID=R4KJ08_9FIRM|nr:DUF559 domain-containing protein [Desulfoscipio gibsoniae]AGL02594.1 hypothetical protein Desgi_3246 [Desulfoscipio gibsoniae DSM 7213]